MQSLPSSLGAPTYPATPVGEDAGPAPAQGTRGLLLIGLFKLSKAIFFFLLGVAALHMMHRNLGDIVMRITDVLPVDPEGRFVSMLMDRADVIGSHQLRQFGLATFAYAAVCLVEGTGLMLRKGWAEYFTVTLTALGLPWESYELLMHFTPLKVVLLLVNLLVLLYLLWFLKRKRRASGEFR